MGGNQHIGERIASALSTQSAIGGRSEYRATDVTAAIGSIQNPLYRILLGAGFCGWGTEMDQLQQIVLRRAWSRWLECHRDGNYNAHLNGLVTVLVLLEWKDESRKQLPDTTKAKLLEVGYRRYVDGLKDHCSEIVSWLNIETDNALQAYQQQMKAK